MEFTGERFVPGKVFGEIEVEHLQRYTSISELVKNKVVLDAACGEGYGSSILAKYAKKVTGMDISAEAVKWAQEKYGSEKLDFITNSIEKLPFSDESFDVIVSFETIEHVNEGLQCSFLKEIKRVLKKDGILIISSPDKLNYSDIPNYNNIYHVKEFYYDEFYGFLNQFFKEVYMFDQGYEKFSVLNSSNFSSSPNNTKVLNKLTNDYRLYIVAVCSDIKIDNIESVNSCMLFRKNHSKLYVDAGDGYSEENVAWANYNLNGKEMIVEFGNLSNFSNIKNLRLVPVADTVCKFKIKKITSNKGTLTAKVINYGDNVGSFDDSLFFNAIYEVNGDFLDLSYIRVEGEMKVVDANEAYLTLDEWLKEKDRQLMQKDRELAQKEQQLNEKDQQLAQRSQQLEQIEGQLKEMLNSRSWKITAPLRRLKKYLQ